MGKSFDRIDEHLREWISRQALFFVATAPLDADAHVNVSPKGPIGSLRVLDDHTVAYLDVVGSGAETIAHLRENGRIVVMFCAFEGRPRIVRLHGRGYAVRPGDPRFDELLPRFSEHPGVRSIVMVDVTRVADSCGFSVPRLDYVADRDVLDLSAAKKGEPAMAAYRSKHNVRSLDGLPGLSDSPTAASSAG